MVFRKLRLSVGCAGGPWGTRDQAYANRNTVLIHHPVSLEAIKSNYKRPLPPHLNLPTDGDPAEQQVAPLHTNSIPPLSFESMETTLEPKSRAPEWNMTRMCNYDRASDIYFIIKHLLRLCDTCLSFLCMIITIDWQSYYTPTSPSHFHSSESSMGETQQKQHLQINEHWLVKDTVIILLDFRNSNRAN